MTTVPGWEQAHTDDIRRIVRTAGYGGCGCEDPRLHQSGCAWQLDPGSRVALSAALIVDPFRAPNWTLDEECMALARIRADRAYALELAAWITRDRGAA